jgi:hypothetical protein
MNNKRKMEKKKKRKKRDTFKAVPMDVTLLGHRVFADVTS